MDDIELFKPAASRMRETKNLTIRISTDLHSRIESVRSAARASGRTFDLSAILVSVVANLVCEAESQLKATAQGSAQHGGTS